MKLSGREAVSYFSRPDPARAGLLIYGPDPMRVALKRQQVIKALIGENGEEEMRLTRLPASELRKDPAMLLDAATTQSFFPGPRVAFVEDATDGLAKTIAAALQDWREGDAQIIVTAGMLNARSSLRKLFEAHPSALAAAVYDDPPGRDEIEAMLTAAGLTRVDSGAMQDVIALSRVLDPGDFRQTLEKLSLYKVGDETPVSSQDVLACTPASTEAALDDVLHCVAEGRDGDIAPVLRKLQAQGVQPVGLCIGATRHFRVLHAAAASGGDMTRVRPPVFGPRRDRMARQARHWGLGRLEQALQLLTDTDLQLRSAAKAPQMALMERALIRLAMLGKR